MKRKPPSGGKLGCTGRADKRKGYSKRRLDKPQDSLYTLHEGRKGSPDKRNPDSKVDATSEALRGITWMERSTLDRALGLYSKYSELEARANKVMLDVNALYLRGKLLKMKELLKGFSVFASEVSKAMLSIANDVKRVMMINNDISRHKDDE
ncbi:MAG: hypothetical protein JW889_03215 [Verrucomicrobia bacterium]|nr:hypothetical protein [Verrucomicrobiota bacterium]